MKSHIGYQSFLFNSYIFQVSHIYPVCGFVVNFSFTIQDLFVWFPIGKMFCLLNMKKSNVCYFQAQFDHKQAGAFEVNHLFLP